MKDRFISHACPFMFGAHHRINIPLNGWFEDEKQLPVRLRCRGFKGVLIVLGALIYCKEDESNGSQTYTIFEEKNKECVRKPFFKEIAFLKTQNSTLFIPTPAKGPKKSNTTFEK